MILVCPGCGRRYRVDETRVVSGTRVRCTGCGKVFDSRPAATPTESASPMAPAPSSRTATAPPRAGGAPVVLIGDENRPFRQAAERALAALGCRTTTTDDGGVAFRFAITSRPALMLLNLRLQGLGGGAVCEGVKGSPHLSGIKVVLVGSTVQPFGDGAVTRQGCEPDDFIEDTVGEAELCRRLGRLLGRAVPAGGPETAPAPGVTAPAAPPWGEALDPVTEIKRLARIMLSDLKLYNPDRFAAAVRDGRMLESFRDELIRGKDLIVGRFPKVPDSVALLTTALREGIDAERAVIGTQQAGQAG